MKLIKTEGIVLKKYDFGEADRIITVLTRSSGRQQYTLNGIRKSKRRDIFASDIGVVSKFVVYEKEQGRGNISSLELLEPLLGLKSDIFKVNVMYYTLALLDKITLEGIETVRIYDLTYKFLKYIEAELEKPQIMKALLYVIYKIIEEEGLGFVNNDGYYFNLEDGLISNERSENTIRLSENEKKMITFLNTIDIKGLNKLKLTVREISGLILIFEEYIKFHLDLNIKLNDFIKEDF